MIRSTFSRVETESESGINKDTTIVEETCYAYGMNTLDLHSLFTFLINMHSVQEQNPQNRICLKSHVVVQYLWKHEETAGEL